MADRLLLAPTVRDDLLEHARDGAPDEVCGVLAGERRVEGSGESGDAPDRVTASHRVSNVAAMSRARYELDPSETMATIEAVEADGDDVVGFYHSHPQGPAGPSATDRARATWTGYVYAIVLPEDDEVRAWRWTGETFEPLTVEIEGEDGNGGEIGGEDGNEGEIEDDAA